MNKISEGVGSWGNVALAIFIAIILCVAIGGLIFWIVRKRTYFLIIPVFRKVGSQVMKVGTYRARVVPLGRAGDTLWFVKGAKKYLPAGNKQTASNEYWYFIREDGEWINVTLEDLDEKSKELGIKFIHQDMRMQRLATDRLLEQRLMNKTFMEKYGMALGLVMVFLIIAVSLTIYLYQFSKVTDKIGIILDKAIIAEQRAGGGGDTGQLIPVASIFMPIPFARRKRECQIG